MPAPSISLTAPSTSFRLCSGVQYGFSLIGGWSPVLIFIWTDWVWPNSLSKLVTTSLFSIITLVILSLCSVGSTISSTLTTLYVCVRPSPESASLTTFSLMLADTALPTSLRLGIFIVVLANIIGIWPSPPTFTTDSYSVPPSSRVGLSMEVIWKVPLRCSSVGDSLPANNKLLNGYHNRFLVHAVLKWIETLVRIVSFQPIST